jgi:hypothetical protein
LLIFLFDDGFGDRAAQAGGERDETLAVLGEQVVVDARFVVEAFEEAGGDQLDQIVVALKRFAEQNEMIGAARTTFHFVAVRIRGGFFTAIVAAALGEVNLATDDGLYVALARFIEKIGGGEKVAMIGDGHGRHFLTRCFVEEFRDFTGAVQEAVVGVDMQVNELRIPHGIRF